jgi:hypothetical protein
MEQDRLENQVTYLLRYRVILYPKLLDRARWKARPINAGPLLLRYVATFTFEGAAPMFAELTGAAGALLLLMGYFLATTGRLAPKSPLLHCLNLAGSGILGTNAVSHHAVALAIFNAIWALIALVELGQLAWARLLKPVRSLPR